MIIILLIKQPLNIKYMSWLEEMDKKQSEKIKATGLQAGWFVNLQSEYGDVWHEIKSTYEPSSPMLSIYEQVDSKSDKIKTELIFYHNVRNVSKELPKDARCVFCKIGAYSERRGNLNHLPK